MILSENVSLHLSSFINVIADHRLLTPMEYRALHTVFTAYKSKDIAIMDVWLSVYHLRVVTLHIIMQLLQSKN